MLKKEDIDLNLNGCCSFFFLMKEENFYNFLNIFFFIKLLNVNYAIFCFFDRSASFVFYFEMYLPVFQIVLDFLFKIIIFIFNFLNQFKKITIKKRKNKNMLKNFEIYYLEKRTI